MALVDYSESGSSSSADEEAYSPLKTSSRKRKTNDDNDTQLGSQTTKQKQSASNSNCTTESLPPPPTTSTPLPALPSTFHSLYATTVRTSILDDPILHSGRIRQTPHIEGNWPTHIYLEWYPSSPELVTLTKLITSLQQQNQTKTTPFLTTIFPTHQHSSSAAPQNEIHTLLHTPLHAQLPLHISLSASLTLTNPQKSLFLDSVTDAIKSSRIKPFPVTLTTAAVEWVANSDRTRWFLVLRPGRLRRAGKGGEGGEGDELNRLLGVCNRAVESYGLPGLYHVSEMGAGTGAMHGYEGGRSGKQAAAASAAATATTTKGASHVKTPDRSSCFHISIAWTLQDPGWPRTSISSDVSNFTKSDITIDFEVVKVKIGNVVHDIPLAGSASIP